MPGKPAKPQKLPYEVIPIKTYFSTPFTKSIVNKGPPESP